MSRHVERIVGEYRRQGFLTAIDDFGAGYAGLTLLAKFQPDLDQDRHGAGARHRSERVRAR